MIITRYTSDRITTQNSKTSGLERRLLSLRTLVLAEDSGLIPITYMVAQNPLNSTGNTHKAHIGTHTYIHICKTLINAHKKI